MLTTYESELFKKVAANPLSVPRQLVSPEINMAGAWFTSPLALRVFPAIARDALNDKSSSFVSLMSQCQFSPEEHAYLRDLWKAGKESGDEDITPIITVMRDDSMKREVNRIWSDYNSKLKIDPVSVRDHINDMGAELANVSHDGVGYDPRPSAHYDDEGIEVSGTWRCKAMDELIGGVPTGGYQLLIAPSGYGKSSYSRSCAAYAVIKSQMGEETQTLIAVNEMDSGVTSRGIRSALMEMWADEKSQDEIERDMDRYVRVYEDAYSFTRFQQMLYWHRPRLAIIDSLDALDFPPGAERYRDDKERHQARAIALHDLSKKYGCFILVPANASGETQVALKAGNLNKVQDATAYNSQWYKNKSVITTIMTWDTMNPQTSLFKNIKHRIFGQDKVGTVISMAHSRVGHYYRDPSYIQL